MLILGGGRVRPPQNTKYRFWRGCRDWSTAGRNSPEHPPRWAFFLRFDWLTSVSEILRLAMVNPHLVCHVDKYSPARSPRDAGGLVIARKPRPLAWRTSGLYWPRLRSIPFLDPIFFSLDQTTSAQYSCSTARVRKGFCNAFYPLFIERLARTWKFDASRKSLDVRTRTR